MLFRELFDYTNPNIDPRDQRFFQMLLMLTLFAGIISFIVSILLIIIQTEIVFIMFSIFAGMINILLYFVCKNGNIKAGFYGLVYLICLAGLMGMIAFGWKSGIYLYLFVIVPTIFFNTTLKKLEMFIMVIIFGLFILCSFYLSFTFPPFVRFDSTQLQVLNISNALLTGLALGGISYLDYRNSDIISNRLIEANERLSYQASRDSLTNLTNRRRINELIEMEHVRSKRSTKPFGLIMADVDDFKQVNDEYGHAAGDFVLTQLAGLLSDSLRKQDVIARWGGEEFLILLPETDLIGVQVAAEKLREIVSHSSFSYQGNMVQVTISFGGVVCHPGEDWDTSIKYADGALYYGKKQGKNLTIFAEGNSYQILKSADMNAHPSSLLNRL